MKSKNIIVVLIIFTFAFIVRFYNFEKRITFGPEQAISLITSGRMITDKFSLLGEQNVQRVNSFGHRIYSGALFSYSLIPLQIIFKFDPVPISAYFALLNILVGYLVFIIGNAIFGKVTALFSSIIFLFSGIMIYHSLFIWNQNYIIMMGILTFYFLFKMKKKVNLIYTFILGLLSGIGISIEYYYFFTILLVFAIILIVSRNKLIAVLLYLFGLIIPNLPAIVFDLRHEFYLTLTLWRYFHDIIYGTLKSSLSYYHFLQFYPLLAIFLGYLLSRLYIHYKFVAVLLVFLYIYLNLNSTWVNFDYPKGMPKELTVNAIYNTAKVINDDKAQDFNVAVLVDFDTRGHILRYPLEFLYLKKPLSVEEYPISNNLYVLAHKDYNFESPDVWELRVINPYSTKKLADVGKDYAVYKLTRNRI